MSRDQYGAANVSTAGGNRSPRSVRRVGELPTVDRSPSRSYPSPLGRKSGRPNRSGNTSPDQHVGYSSYGHMGSPYYGREDDIGSPTMMDERGRSAGTSGGHHRSRSASRPAMSTTNPMATRYQSLDRASGIMGEGHEREFMPIREPRDRSMDRSAVRDRYLEDELYSSRSARQSPNPHSITAGVRDASGMYIDELQSKNNDLQRELANFKKELELTNQKLGSSMHSIKTFWSPELKKERALRKEESAKYSLMNDQLKLLNSENQKQAMLVRQLEEELRMRMRNPSVELQQQMEILYAENEHLTREIAILRETIKELELRIDTQKQTLQARDESIKKLLEMLQNKGVGGKMLDEERMEFESMQARLIESEDRTRHYEMLVRNRDQELTKTKRELKATNETLRALQVQLEKAYTQNSSGPSNSTLTAIMETKDARIATLEKEVALLEQELDRIRENAGMGGTVRETLMRGTSPIPLMDVMMMDHSAATATASLPKHDFSYKRQLDEFRTEIQRRDQEILAMSAKMKTLEEQHQDYQRHIAVLKESLCAKEEHYNMLQADVEELRQRLEEKNRHIEKKTVTATQATQERNRLNNELNELRDHMDIKDRKINVLQRKLDLHEANKKLANGAARAGEETTALKMQLDEQKKQLEDQRRKLEEHKKGLDSKSRQLEEKEKSIADLDQKLKKRKEKLDQLEAQMQRQSAAAGGGREDSEFQKRLSEMQQELEANHTELEKTREDAQRSQVEMERLLQLVQMSQEEQNAKEKMIRDLQEALKNAQAKLRSQQNVNAQLEEQRRREEVEVQDKSVEANIEKDNVQTVQALEQDVHVVEDALVGQHKALCEEVAKKDAKILDMEQQIHALEIAFRNHSHMTELEELVGVVHQKNERIEELEEALRESVRITAEQETVLQQEESRRKQIMEKVGKLEQRLLSLQTAHALRCSTCRPLLTRLQDFERRLTQLLAERRGHLQDLAQMKQEALEAAISEKDAHLALLEVSGIRTARQAQQADQLHADRRRLTEKLKEENEWSVCLLQEYSDPDEVSLGIDLLDLEEDDDSNCRHTDNKNDSVNQQNEVGQDSNGAVSQNTAPSPT